MLKAYCDHPHAAIVSLGPRRSGDDAHTSAGRPGPLQPPAAWPRRHAPKERNAGNGHAQTSAWRLQSVLYGSKGMAINWDHTDRAASGRRQGKADVAVDPGELLWLVKRTFTRQRRGVEDAMRANGVTAAQAGVLVELVRDPGISSSDLARKLDITAQAATLAVAALEQRGLIKRIAHPTHGRVRRCFLTRGESGSPKRVWRPGTRRRKGSLPS